MISLPEAKLEPFSLPLIRNKCPKPLQWITPCRRWLCKSRNLPISPGSSPHEGHLRNLVTMGSLQLGHCSCALAPPWPRFIPANLRDRSDVCSGAGIMKWYRMLETGWWLHPASNQHNHEVTTTLSHSIQSREPNHLGPATVRRLKWILLKTKTD